MLWIAYHDKIRLQAHFRGLTLGVGSRTSGIIVAVVEGLTTQQEQGAKMT